MTKIRRFREDRSGNVAVTFAVALLPLIFFVGGAIDYTRATMAGSRLQGAVDVAALALSKAATSLNGSQMDQRATDTISALMSGAEVTLGTVSTTYTTTGRKKVTVKANATVPTTFMKVAGVQTIAVAGDSTVVWGNTRLRVGLVLDNTGSMADDGKLGALKTASHNLLTKLEGTAQNPGDVYVSIIPFNKDVNVGAANYTANWLRWDTWSNRTCIFVVICTTNTDRRSWNGCVTDRDQNFDTTATVPTASQAAAFPAEQYSSCPTSLMGLSYDWTSLHAKIDAMTASGNTNQTIGLQWGLQSLDANSPLANPPLDPNYQYKRVIVMLTDGLNTQNRWSTTQSAIDARTLAVCGNIKSAGYTLYVVQTNTGGDPTSSMLQQCATSAATFFVLTSASQIVTTFDQIATELTQTYISH